MEIALYKPEIPPNTGNIARLSVCTNSPLHIIDKPAFSMDEASVRRAGLDYWDQVNLKLHENWDKFLEHTQKNEIPQRVLLFSKFGNVTYSSIEYQKDDILVFGQETSGLPDFVIQNIVEKHPEHILRIPVREGCRSLNLANAVALVLYEGLRQMNFPGLAQTFKVAELKA